MNNTQALRSLLKGYSIEDEAVEFLDAIDEEFDDNRSEAINLSQQIEELENKAEQLEDELSGCETHIIAGMDTIYIKLDQGNLEIQSRVDTFVERLKKHYNAAV